MWDSLGRTNRLLGSARAVLILPALIGALICYTILWMPVRIWPSKTLFGIVTILLLSLAIRELTVLRRLLSQKILDVENLTRIIGIMLALLLGLLWVLPRIHQGL